MNRISGSGADPMTKRIAQIAKTPLRDATRAPPPAWNRKRAVRLRRVVAERMDELVGRITRLFAVRCVRVLHYGAANLLTERTLMRIQLIALVLTMAAIPVASQAQQD